MEVKSLPVEMNGERYYTSSEAIEYLGISRDTFYRRVKKRLPVYHYGVLRKREYFRESDLDQFRGFHPAEENEPGSQ